MSYSKIQNYYQYFRLHLESVSLIQNFESSSVDRDLYILGTGPSLNDFDFERLQNADVFLLNNALSLSEKLDCFRHFGVMTDFLRIQEFKENLNSIDVFSSTDKVFNEDVDWTVYKKTCFLLPKINVNTLSVDFSQSASTDITQGVFIGKSVLFFALQIATFFKPKRVFLVGIDMTNGQGEYFNKSIKSNWSQFDYPRDGRAHLKAIKNYYDQIDIPLFNVSRSSAIQELPLG